jgi:hypothetical protein
MSDGLQVSDVYDLPPDAIGKTVRVTAMLLGARFDRLDIADSFDAFDMGIVIPVIDDDVVERTLLRGVTPIGGGRFGFRYKCTIEAELAAGFETFKYSLRKPTFLVVSYRGREVMILQG